MVEVTKEQVNRVQNLIRDTVDYLREMKATDEEIVAVFLSETIEILASYPEKERIATIRRIDKSSKRDEADA